MKVSQIKEILNANVLVGVEGLDTEIYTACGSDLMSDVMAFVKNKVVLLTGLINPQVIRTAEMMDIKCVIFVRGKVPDQSVLDLAEEKNIIVLTTQCPMYIACGKLYSSGLIGSGFECDNE